MRKTCVNMVYELAKRDPRVLFIGSDLSPGLLKEMKAEMPERHYMEGIAEQAVIGMAAGFAFDGYMPFVNTIATFITRRCYEQVALDVCLHDLPVRLIGNGGGVVYAPLGPTHLAVEDFALMRALPNMAVTAVCDADEMVRLMEATLDYPHPIYIRLAKGGDKIVSRAENGFAIGKGILMHEASTPAEALLISTGVMTTNALAAAEMVANTANITVNVLHLHTIKPLDVAMILEQAARVPFVFTIEEHTQIGGLGSAVLECLHEQATFSLPKVKRLALPDAFVHHYGSQGQLWDHYGLSSAKIAHTLLSTLRG